MKITLDIKVSGDDRETTVAVKTIDIPAAGGRKTLNQGIEMAKILVAEFLDVQLLGIEVIDHPLDRLYTKRGLPLPKETQKLFDEDPEFKKETTAAMGPFRAWSGLEAAS